MNLKITDGERARYTQIYGRDPLACDGWLIQRMKKELTVLGYELAGTFHLLDVTDGETVEAPALCGTRPVVLRVRYERHGDASTFHVLLQ